MRRAFACLLLTALLLPATAARADELDAAWADRHSAAKAKAMVELGERLVRERPAEYAAHWKLVRAYYFLGSYFTTGDEAQRDVFNKGKPVAERALELNPAGIDGYYWHAVILGKWGTANGILKSLAAVGPMKKSLQKVIALDRGYEDGGGQRVMGRLYHKLPFFKGGSNAKAIEQLQAALAFDPAHKLTAAYLGEVLNAEDRFAEACAVLEKAKAAPIVQERVTEERSWLEEIEKALAGCRGK